MPLPGGAVSSQIRSPASPQMASVDACTSVLGGREHAAIALAMTLTESTRDALIS